MAEASKQASSQLRANAISVRHLVFFVVAAAAPLTVAAGFFPLGFLFGGESLPAGFVIAGIVYTVFAVGFTAMSRHVTDAGAFSAYIAQGLGHRWGSSAAAVAWTGYTLGQIGFTAVAGFFGSIFLETYWGIQVSWGVVATVISLVVIAISYAQITLGARVAAVLLTLEIAILFLFIFSVWIKGTPEGISFGSFNPGNWDVSAMGAVFVVAFLVFIGFEQTAVYSEEAKDPRRTISRATYTAIGVLTVVYTLAAWTILMAVGPKALPEALQGDVSGLVFQLNTDYVGQTSTDLMQALVITSFAAGVLALQNAGARYLFSMGRRRILPVRLAHVGADGSPTTAVLVQGVIVTVALVGFGVSGLDPYTQVAIWTNSPTLFAVLALQIMTSVAVLVWFRRAKLDESPWRTTIAPALAIVLLAIVLYLGVANMELLTFLGPVGNSLVLSPLVVAAVLGFSRGGVDHTREVMHLDVNGHDETRAVES